MTAEWGTTFGLSTERRLAACYLQAFNLSCCGDFFRCGHGERCAPSELLWWFTAGLCLKTCQHVPHDMIKHAYSITRMKASSLCVSHVPAPVVSWALLHWGTFYTHNVAGGAHCVSGMSTVAAVLGGRGAEQSPAAPTHLQGQAPRLLNASSLVFPQDLCVLSEVQLKQGVWDDLRTQTHVPIEFSSALVGFACPCGSL